MGYGGGTTEFCDDDGITPYPLFFWGFGLGVFLEFGFWVELSRPFS